MKTITFAIPCYNSAEYMDKCIESILACRDEQDDLEIIIVDDGSFKDDTPAKADQWAADYPTTIRAIHQENGGHGQAVNTGLANATGLYFKVVDSDDWLDKDALQQVINYARTQVEDSDPTDLIIANYVYEKVYEGTSTTIRYTNVFPQGREFGWDDIKRFSPSQYLLMHSVMYRTQVLRDSGIKLPAHTFYVDNIFVYVPLPYVGTIYYLDVDMYRYFIGREDQSVNESIMYKRRDQQVLITRVMIDSVDVDAVESKKLRKYMLSYLSMMMCICTVFLRMKRTKENTRELNSLWGYLRDARPDMYLPVRANILNLGMNLPTELGRRIGLGGYHVAQKIFKFN
ncbi:glycosyltransferase family 2 protein [Slackia heliotrinireducens]|uniref:glycosyltransferase family 2 protein n=1 Tax=Slackia heliotrinireducens TaxID=84110 RepID=UPI003315CBD1